MTATLRTQDVVCAFILSSSSNADASASGKDDAPFRLLCSQRYDDAEHFPSMYEFPGGKVDGDESHLEALRRECREELGVDVEFLYDSKQGHEEANGDASPTAPSAASLQPCFSFSHAPKHDQRLGQTVVFRLFFYWARVASKQDGQAKALASQKIEWLSPKEMQQLPFCPGDDEIIDGFVNGTLCPASPLRAFP